MTTADGRRFRHCPAKIGSVQLRSRLAGRSGASRNGCSPKARRHPRLHAPDRPVGFPSADALASLIWNDAIREAVVGRRHLMRIAFHTAAARGQLTGIGNYIVELGRELAKFPDVEAYSFCELRWHRGLPERTPDDAPAAPGNRARGRLARIASTSLPLRRTRDFVKSLAFSRGLRRYGIDLYHEQNYVPLSYAVPVVVTVHDLSWLHYPGAHPADRVRWLQRGVPKALELASAIVVVSEFVRREVLKTFSLEPERVRAIYPGIGDQFRPRSAQETAATLHSLRLTHGRYVLCVGTIEPRKNLVHALESFLALPPRLRDEFPLVVAGASGWHGGDVERRLRVLTRAGQVRFVGYVPALQLQDLYSGAALFLFPSLYEGFGSPPLEAMASGVPAIVSNRASLPEVVGEARLTAELLQSLLEDSALRKSLSDTSLERAQRFTWRECAARTHGVYRQVCGT
jgi:O-antigen biosynthesis alpha-1,3-rhamnosyltransferase